MNAANAVVAAMFVGVTLYALFAGADFGGGFWDLFAGGTERGAPSAAADRAVGRTGVGSQPRLADLRAGRAVDRLPARVRARSCRRCAIPLTLAAVGIILRGAAFAFRKASIALLDLRRAFGACFASSSVLTPFFLGASSAGSRPAGSRPASLRVT